MVYFSQHFFSDRKGGILFTKHFSDSHKNNMDYSPWFWPKTEIFDLGKRPSERALQEEQNSANFSFIAPSSEEL